MSFCKRVVDEIHRCTAIDERVEGFGAEVWYLHLYEEGLRGLRRNWSISRVAKKFSRGGNGRGPREYGGFVGVVTQTSPGSS